MEPRQAISTELAQSQSAVSSSPLGELFYLLSSPWSDLHAGGVLSGLAPAIYLCSSVQVTLKVSEAQKLIGARYFNKGYIAIGGNTSYPSPRDFEGHGTHTLSTAGGNIVPVGGKVFPAHISDGVLNVKGGSPKARVASYKVCWYAPGDKNNGCFYVDMLEAINAAIHDGVDVISMSMGVEDVTDYFNDAVAIGSFHAVKKGIVVVAAAGNSGPADGTVTNAAPWLITVGAATMDRRFESVVQLANGLSFKGASLSGPLSNNTFYKLITGAQAKAANVSDTKAMLCEGDTLDPAKVMGKILVCLRQGADKIDATLIKSLVAADAGAMGMVLCNDELTSNELLALPFEIPSSNINYRDGLALIAYTNSTVDPRGSLTAPKAQFDTKPAPSVPFFSSRGPNPITPEILKPDIVAPGVRVIAAYSEAQYIGENQTIPYMTLDGTSMACPHVSGIVALKKLHPDWSPAAIKSAIMTTARTRDNTVHPMLDRSSVMATPFSYGAGHIRAARASDPGLVYDLIPTDYLDFLCAIGYNHSMIKEVSEENYSCPNNASLLNFNYPSITVPNLSNHSVTVAHSLKNVGSPAIYAAHIREPQGVSVLVEPKTLRFDMIGEEKSFTLTIKAKRNGLPKGYVFGELHWSEGHHQVRSRIVVGSRVAK
ncbi:Subtilisin-like protease [Actinidia chinensis var. chinensis]|uniref:Subtilisin-like protease n=1 Tax=Actinidia chinensis var. chinensis TaxID=1590841 RepID=A0A2R6PB67_ACTCC|nr:Subtilisin-like protease [Actinidia chinensis var. chinensis]